jgi:uncharacterized membrane protein
MRYATAGRRFLTAAVCGLAGGALVSPLGPWQASVLFGWDAAAMVYLMGVWSDIRGTDTKATAEIATREDNSRASADLMLIGASLGSLAAVLLVLVEAAHSQGVVKAVLSVFAIVSVFLSWAVVHTVFMLHYAHLYFSEPSGGIDFHENKELTYIDFAYVAFTIGMTFQVSDTDLTTRPLRRSALRHALLSYVFGTVIVATMINVIAGLVR